MRVLIENTNDNGFIFSFKFKNVIPWFGVNEDGIFLYNNKNYKEGDIVEVSITLDNKKMYNDGFKYGFKIEDAIPNNMTFVEYVYDRDYSGYLRKQDGQKLTISVWNPYDPKWNPSATKSTLKYKVRVTNSGEQFEPGTIMAKYTNEIVDGIK